MKRFLIPGFLAVAMTLVTASPVFAARIYNFLPVPIAVAGGTLYVVNGTAVGIQPGQKSESLAWNTTTVVSVFAPHYNVIRSLCDVSFGVHAEIQGGNYMTIGHRGDVVICTVCNSSHGTIANNSKRYPNPPWDVNKNPESRTGC